MTSATSTTSRTPQRRVASAHGTVTRSAAARAIDRMLGDLDAGSVAALARAVSVVENHRPGFDRLLAALHARTGKARRIGLTGPPGAGKSTLLMESGLNFPAMGQGPRGVRGIGGTRNCDWWFTEEAILLDTAGRYTTQDDDRAEWDEFLQLLKKTRRQSPINGALVVVSVEDLLAMSEAGI